MIGGSSFIATPSYLAERVGGLMSRVDANFQKCVVFVGAETAGQFIPHGTGFVGGVKFEGFDFFFVVTASHVLDDMNVDEPEFSIRMNRRDGGASTVRLKKSHAVRHQRLENDIALVPIMFDPTVYDFKAIEIDRAALQKGRQNFWGINLGDEVFAMGLYTSQYGLSRTFPSCALATFQCFSMSLCGARRGTQMRT